MNCSYVTQDLSDDDDIAIMIVIKPNVVTPNKPLQTSTSNIPNTARKYDKSWTGFKRICNTAFPYHGDNSFAAAAYGYDPNVELLRNTTSTSPCGKKGKDEEIGSFSSLRLDRTKHYVTANPIFQSIARLIFNIIFKSFYEFAMCVNNISPELIEITDTEYGVISHNVRFYARTKE